MNIEQELIEAANFAHNVTGCSIKRHLSMRASDEIKSLRAQLSECHKAALLEAAAICDQHGQTLGAICGNELRRMAEG